MKYLKKDPEGSYNALIYLRTAGYNSDYYSTINVFIRIKKAIATNQLYSLLSGSFVFKETKEGHGWWENFIFWGNPLIPKKSKTHEFFILSLQFELFENI